MSKNKVPLEDSSDELENDEEAQLLIRQAEEKKRSKAKVPTEPPTTPKKPSSADHPLTPSRSSPRKTPRKTPNKACYSIFRLCTQYRLTDRAGILETRICL